jgi:YjbR protein
MVADEFRRIALSFRDAAEGRHHGHPDFRVHGKIFATLGYPDGGWAMVKLTTSQQARFVAAHPDCFQCVKGAWGRRGATNVNLFAATATLARRSLALAHRNVTSSERRTVIRAATPAHPAAKRKAS